MVRTIELWWIGLGAIGTALTILLGTWIRPEEWRQIKRELRWGTYGRTVQVVLIASMLGPITLTVPLWYLIDPIGYGMSASRRQRNPERKGSKIVRLAPYVIVLFIIWTFVIEPMRTGSW